MNSKTIGLDIGESLIRAIELNREKNGFSLAASIASPTPAKGMLSESPLDEEDMGKAVKRVLSDAGISKKSVNVALPENQVYTKVVEMPYLSDRELNSAIYWEAEQYIPIPLENVSLAWNVIKRSSKPKPGEKMKVLMVGAPTIIVSKYQKVLSLARLSLNALETEILSKIRAITYTFPPKSSTPILVMDIGSQNTSLAIVLGRDLFFTYSLPVGGLAINRAIAADFGLTRAQADEYKRTYGITNSNVGQRISRATEPIMSSILTEVKKAMIYYSQKFPESKIEQLVISGSTARIPGMDKYFANGAGIETVIANPWKILGNQNVPKEILYSGPEYATAVGLALREYEQ